MEQEQLFESVLGKKIQESMSYNNGKTTQWMYKFIDAAGYEEEEGDYAMEDYAEEIGSSLLDKYADKTEDGAEADFWGVWKEIKAYAGSDAAANFKDKKEAFMMGRLHNGE